MTGASPSSVFLTEFARHLRGSPEDRARVFSEVQDHLADLVAEGIASGLSEHAAEQAAVARFGPPRSLAKRMAPQPRRRRLVLVAVIAAALACSAAIGIARLEGAGHKRLQPRPAGASRAISAVPALMTSMAARTGLSATRVLAATIDQRVGVYAATASGGQQFIALGGTDFSTAFVPMTRYLEALERSPIVAQSSGGGARAGDAAWVGVAGMVADGVAHLDVVDADGTRSPIQLANNSFAFTVQNAPPPTELVATSISGSELSRLSLPRS